MFDIYINNIVSKAFKSLCFIMRISKCFKDIKILKFLYCTYVRSNLKYASSTWNPKYHKYIERIENVQK